MDDFRTIMDLRAGAASVPPGLSLVVSLISNPDHGQLARQMEELLLGDLGGETPPVRIADFDPDALFDYRSRRPIVLLEQDHLSEISSVALTLELCSDGNGTKYLFLRGFEPDFNWGKIIVGLKYLIDRFSVGSVTIVHGVGIPVPHTREIASTVSGNRHEMVDRWSAWQPITRIPANFVHILELALTSGPDQVPTTTFHILVPHYLGELADPHVAIAAARRVNDAAGIWLASIEKLEEAIPEFEERVATILEENEELSSMIHLLESRIDEHLADLQQQQKIEVDLNNLPSGDELAAEFETFLAGQGNQADDGPAQGLDS